MKNSISILLCVLCAIFATVGCGKNVKLSGRVTFSDDGAPLEKGVVVFDTGTFIAQGPIASDGRYVVGSISTRDGLPPGNYKVYIIDSERIVGTKPSGFPILEPLIEAKYTNATQTPLSFEVGPSKKKYDIAVERWSQK